MWVRMIFLYYSYVCRVKTMSFESAGGGREPRASENQLTHIPVSINPWPLPLPCFCQFHLQDRLLGTIGSILEALLFSPSSTKYYFSTVLIPILVSLFHSIIQASSAGDGVSFVLFLPYVLQRSFLVSHSCGSFCCIFPHKAHFPLHVWGAPVDAGKT